MRGKRGGRCLKKSRKGSIPACAGETMVYWLDGRADEVYPRVCGGNPTVMPSPACQPGLSPRVRGKRRSVSAAAPPGRSIPACAGETVSVRSGKDIPRVYPRVCGGNWDSCLTKAIKNGLSPRVRGKQLRAIRQWGSGRSIPACAGETKGPGRPSPAPRVYPRVCGGN